MTWQAMQGTEINGVELEIWDKIGGACRVRAWLYG